MLAISLIILSVSGAPASQIYKCRLPTGVVSFQEKACARGTHLKTIVVPSVPPAKAAPIAQISATPGAPATSSAAAAAPAPSTASASIPPVTPGLSLPPAAYYRCATLDGSSYFSGSPLPKRHEVAVSKLTDPALSLGPAGPGMVWVEDQCVEVPISEACAYYQQQLEFVVAQQRVLSGLALKKSIQEQQRLNTIRAARCRGG